MPWQEESELQSVLATILKFVRSSNTGRVKLDIQPGRIDMFVGDSREMFS